MTSHYYWFKTYTHCRKVVCLADNSIIYSASVKSVIFKSTIHGKRARTVEFSNILHILDLRSNLLSCSSFTCSKGFEIDISSHTIIFKKKLDRRYKNVWDSSGITPIALSKGFSNETLIGVR